MYTYFIKPRSGTKEVDEEDLDEPTSLQIEQELSKLVPGSRVFDTASRKSEPETEGAVRFILEYLFVCLFVFVLRIFRSFGDITITDERLRCSSLI